MTPASEGRTSASPRSSRRAGVRELDALRRAGGARRVDDREHVVGLHGPPLASKSKSGAGADSTSVERQRLRRVAVDDHDVLERVPPSARAASTTGRKARSVTRIRDPAWPNW